MKPAPIAAILAALVVGGVVLAANPTRERLSASSSSSGGGSVTGTAPIVVTGSDVSCTAASASSSGCLQLVGGNMAVDAGINVVGLGAVRFASTTNITGVQFENGDYDWKLRKTAGTDTADLGLYADTSLWLHFDLSNGFIRPQYSIVSDVASGGNAYRSDTGAKWCPGAGATGCFIYSATAPTVPSVLFSTGIGVGAALTFSPTTPTLTAFGGTGASITGTAAAFQINVGTVAPGSTGTITLPGAANGWVCHCNDVTSALAVSQTLQTGVGTTTTCPIGNYTVATGVALNWSASDKIVCTATAY